jgi:peptidase inhibitor I78 family protein
MTSRHVLGMLALLGTLSGNAFTQSALPAARGCKEESARFAVGGQYSDELAERARRAAGAGVVRRIAPGEADTMELRADRPNLDVDGSGRILRVWCG